MRNHLAALVALVLGSIPAGRAAADIELKNDGWTPGMTAHFYSGTNNTGEISAARFTAPGPGHRLTGLKVIFGGANQVAIVTLRVWNDPGGPGNAPGAEVFHGDFQVQGNNNVILQDVPLAGAVIVLPEKFRLGLEAKQPGPPRVAFDYDGTLAADKNYLYAVPGGWLRSGVAGIQGDWMLRPVISDTGMGGTIDAGVDAPGPDGGDGPDAGGGPDAGSGGDCATNVECPVGHYCDPDQHLCTLDCREAADCGGGATCNSFGQCVGGGGCCETGSGGTPPGVLALAGLVGLLVVRRRRA